MGGEGSAGSRNRKRKIFLKKEDFHDDDVLKEVERI
jgi:hypothetical protein